VAHGGLVAQDGAGLAELQPTPTASALGVLTHDARVHDVNAGPWPMVDFGTVARRRAVATPTRGW
jgi:hypothetical protein